MITDIVTVYHNHHYYYTLARYIGICPYIHKFVRMYVHFYSYVSQWRHRCTDFISSPIITELHTRVHKPHLMYKFENGHHRSHETPLNMGLLTPEN